ncbi:hypothetical protein [Burkholderia anthina]
MMVSINDHEDIRRVFTGFPMLELDISYSVNGKVPRKGPKSRELVITNWTPRARGREAV